MTINTVNLSNTFDEWRTIDNEVISKVNTHLDSTILNTLDTNDKTNYPSAINEVNTRTIITGTVTGTGDAIVITPNFTVDAYTTSTFILYIPTSTNTTTTPQLNIFGLSQKFIKNPGNENPKIGQLSAGKSFLLHFDGTYLKIISQNRLQLIETSVKTTDYTSLVFDFVPVNSNSGAINITLPASPQTGDRVAILDVYGSSNTITILRNGNNINNNSSDIVFTNKYQLCDLLFIGGYGWYDLNDYQNKNIVFAVGSVSAPSITFNGDTNTGIYHPSADNLSLVTGGIARLNIDSNGNVILPTGNFTLTSGNVVISAGNVTISTGNLTMTTGYIDMNNHRIQNVADSTTSTDAANVKKVLAMAVAL